MQTIKRVIISSHASADHINFVMGLRSGFQELGVDVVTTWPHPNMMMLSSISENFVPDAVIEINRSRDQIQDHSTLKHGFANVPHVTIIHDAWAFGVNYSETKGDSSLYYSIIPPCDFGYPKNVGEKSKAFMPPIYSNLSIPQKEKSFDLGLIGHMSHSNIIRKKTLKANLIEQFPALGTYFDLLKTIKIDHKTLLHSKYMLDIQKGIIKYFANKGIKNFATQYPVAQRQLEEQVSMTITRALNRSFVAKKMLKISSSIGFWGPSAWLSWDDFAPHYQRYLSNTKQLYEAFSQLKINIHSTGTNLHTRIVESMAVGTPNAIMHNDTDDGPFGIEQYFEPDVDFIRTTPENFVDKIQYYLAHPQLLEDIANSAKEKILAHHTWKHRCQEIIDDLMIKATNP